MENLYSLLLALPWVDLPDSLTTLTALAAQLQTVISTAIAHPIWAIVLLLLTIVLIQILADLIKRLLKTSLTFVLRLPLILSQWLWQKATATAQPSQTAQLSQLLTRLDALRQEQDQVISELKSLLPKADTRPADALGQSVSQSVSMPAQPSVQSVTSHLSR